MNKFERLIILVLWAIILIYGQVRNEMGQLGGYTNPRKQIQTYLLNLISTLLSLDAKRQKFSSPVIKLAPNKNKPN